MSVQLLKKMSAKNIISGKIRDRLPKDENGNIIKDGVADLFRVYGRSLGCRADNSLYGRFVEFQGQFEAIDLQTGVISTASKLFLPEPIQTALEQATMSEDNKTGIDFAFDIYIQEYKSDTTGAGYEFKTKTVLDVKQSNALDDLKSKLPALPAPKVQTVAIANEAEAKASKKK